ncbi:unnamed protein product [marine sediment metagenome]|uniref:Uncharacterized protein n=1 Tax=marine sediment metagenome TaxID=412755 RepID=X1G2X1_9ZZZZ
MALTTKTMGREVKVDGESDVPEGYEFIRDDEGRMALKKIRVIEDLKVQEVAETEELIKQPAKKSKTKSKKVGK